MGRLSLSLRHVDLGSRFSVRVYQSTDWLRLLLLDLLVHLFVLGECTQDFDLSPLPVDGHGLRGSLEQVDRAALALYKRR